MRIAVQLNGAENGYLAQNIVQTLRLTLTAEERGALQKAPASDVQAYDHRPRGRKFHYHFNRRDIEFAIQLFSRAVELDPEAAQAQTSRGVALGLYRRDEEAVRAFGAAIRLDPNLFKAYYFSARHSFARGELDKASRLYEQATLIRPEDYQSRLLAGQIYDDLGRPQDARAARNGLLQKGWFEHDSNLDPLRSHPRFQSLLGLLE